MKKRILLLMFLFAMFFSINLVSASFLDPIENSLQYMFGYDAGITIALIAFFILFEQFLQRLVFSKLFRGPSGKTTSAVISILFALSAVYGLAQINLQNLFYSIGISEGLLMTIGIIVIIVASIFASRAKDKVTGKRKFRLRRFIGILGAVLIAVGILAKDIIYRNDFLIWAGVILAFISALAWLRDKKKRRNRLRNDYGPFPQGPSQQRREEIVKNNSEEGSSGTKLNSRRLKKLAKTFKKMAERTKNPSFYGGWANFVGWLRKQGHGRNELEQCSKFRVSRKTFRNIFQKYGMVVGKRELNRKEIKKNGKKLAKEMRKGLRKNKNNNITSAPTNEKNQIIVNESNSNDYSIPDSYKLKRKGLLNLSSKGKQISDFMQGGNKNLSGKEKKRLEKEIRRREEKERSKNARRKVNNRY